MAEKYFIIITGGAGKRLIERGERGRGGGAAGGFSYNNKILVHKSFDLSVKGAEVIFVKKRKLP